MAKFLLPPPGEDTPDLLKLRISHAMSLDISQREKADRRWRLVQSLFLCCTKGGSGFHMANLLREYFVEYAHRIVKHSFHSLPSSFNVVESFLRLRRDSWFWEIREESEFLLSLDEYFGWYNRNQPLLSPSMLSKHLSPERVYSYNFVNHQNTGTLCTDDSSLIIAGVSLVRHQDELSIIVMAGENPPHLSGCNVDKLTGGRRFRGKEEIQPAEGLSSKHSELSQYLDGYVGFGRVVVLARLDLASGRCNARYVNLDLGPAFVVYTDEFGALDDLDPVQRGLQEEKNRGGLERYKSLLAASVSLIFLPQAIASKDFGAGRERLEFKTELATIQSEREFREAAKILGSDYCKLSRKVLSVRSSSPQVARPDKVKAPEFASDGYWKKLSPGRLGEDIDGKPIVGRTWVTRTDSWSSVSAEEFVLTKQPAPVEGVDPGIVYVMRSSAHGLNVYKVGLTRRTVDIRANELTRSTATPLPFEVLASFEVGDCCRVESEVHERLEAYRVSSNREFFRADLQIIISTINQVVSDLVTS